ncbi:MAG: sigma 54-interacting transcriptional regulator [Deltaproteobacteria bacterium]|jgi:arginine utilization regulatory protein|nr:sigma 54-interacting transcriptional regulator [Deltaproteobacteria bacterium]
MRFISLETFTGALSSGELVSQIFDDFSTGVTIVDFNSEIVYLNAAQAKIDNIEPTEALGKKITDLQKVGDKASHPIILALISRKPLVNKSCVYYAARGKLVNTIQNVFAIVKDGALLGCISFSNEYDCFLETYNLDLGTTLKSEEQEEVAKLPSCHIVTEDKSYLSCLDIVSKSADTPSPILMYGERGSGKHMLARYIHANSIRRDKPFITLNCSSIPENILEGLLFGTVEGAFTASVDRPGVLELANGGTLFLDSIETIPVGLQKKISKAIKDQKVRRVGSSNSDRDFSIKFISALGVAPNEAVECGRLKPELLMRLGAVMVALPPLRERKGDIPLLTDHFVKRHNELLGKKVENLDDELKDSFKCYRWPGNVRELENAIEGAMNMVSAEETKLTTGHFSSTLLAHMLSESRALSFARDQVRPPHYLHRPAEAERIASALEAAGGNAAKAARSLKISPQLMNYKLKKFSLKKNITVHVE